MASTSRKAQESCFVIMPFGGMWDEYYSKIYVPAITRCDLMPVRADDVFRAGSILQDIVDLLQRSSVALVDISEGNRNVHYELGLAHALGKPTILVAPENLPLFFDVGQERMIAFNKENAFWGQELSDAIARTLAETLRSPESAVPTAFMHIKPTRLEADEVIVRLQRIESQLAELSRAGLMKEGSGSSRLASILQGLPAAEIEAERLLGPMSSDEVKTHLMREGYREAMAEAAVSHAVAIAKKRNSGATQG